MMLSKIDLEILEILIEKGEYATGVYISDVVGVATKTIYRRIKHIRSVFGEEIIASQAGKGYKINYEIYLSLLNEYYSKNSQEMSIDNRRISILLNLLTNSPDTVSIEKLSKKYFVSQTSIVNDLDYIKKIIDSKNLKLSQTNEGTQIIGQETEIRKELMHIFTKFLTDIDGSALKVLTNKSNTIEQLKTQFDIEEINAIKSILDSARNLLGYELENPYYTNLLTHLLILLKRHNNNEDTNKNNHIINNFDSHKFQVAKYIISEISNKFDITINPKEVNYVYTYCYLD